MATHLSKTRESERDPTLRELTDKALGMGAELEVVMKALSDRNSGKYGELRYENIGGFNAAKEVTMQGAQAGEERRYRFVDVLDSEELNGKPFGANSPFMVTIVDKSMGETSKRASITSLEIPEDKDAEKIKKVIEVEEGGITFRFEFSGNKISSINCRKEEKGKRPVMLRRSNKVYGQTLAEAEELLQPLFEAVKKIEGESGKKVNARVENQVESVESDVREVLASTIATTSTPSLGRETGLNSYEDLERELEMLERRMKNAEHGEVENLIKKILTLKNRKERNLLLVELMVTIKDSHNLALMDLLDKLDSALHAPKKVGDLKNSLTIET